MFKVEIIGYVTESAVIKTTPARKEYVFFIINEKDEKGKESFIKCYYYGCSKDRCKSIQAGKKIIVWGRQNLSIFEKDNGEREINININVTEIYFP